MTGRLKAKPETWLFLAVGSLVLLLAQHELLPASSRTLALLLAVAVVLTGLPHGALDPWVAWRAGLWRTRAGLAAFHLAYVALAACVLVLWQLAPGASLALFLVISAWHFGGDWQKELNVWARAACGLALLALPAWTGPVDVSAIFALLSGEQGRLLAGWLGAAGPWFALAAAASALLVLPRSPAVAIELGTIGALAWLLPPLVFFLVYFCALHSPRHLRKAVLSEDAGQRHRMICVAVAYTGLTLLAAALLWPWFAGDAASPAALESHLVRTVVIGLAALTWPHMIVVMLSEQRGRTRP